MPRYADGDDHGVGEWTHPTSIVRRRWNVRRVRVLVGVVHEPQAPTRTLTERELVAHELAIRSRWASCAHLSDEIERGRDPLVPDEWGWRYSRAMRCRLANPRPQESAQQRFMREAIFETSGLLGHLDQALDALREVAR